MRAALAFLNGAGSRRRRQSGSTDRGLLALTDLLVNSGFPGKQVPVPSARARANRGRSSRDNLQ